MPVKIKVRIIGWIFKDIGGAESFAKNIVIGIIIIY